MGREEGNEKDVTIEREEVKERDATEEKAVTEGKENDDNVAKSNEDYFDKEEDVDMKSIETAGSPSKGDNSLSDDKPLAPEDSVTSPNKTVEETTVSTEDDPSQT